MEVGRHSLSSKSSSSSSDSSSGSGSTSSSSSSDSEDEVQVPQGKVGQISFSAEDGKEIPANENGVASAVGRIVATGTVVNEKIRVVPVKERTGGSINTKVGKKRKRCSSVLAPDERSKGKKRLKDDDDWRYREKYIHVDEFVEPKFLRDRKTMPIFNEDLLIRMQKEIVETSKLKNLTISKVKKNTRKNYKEVEKLAEQKELDGDAPETYLRASGKTADWDSYLNTKDVNYLKRIADVSKFAHAPLAKCWKHIAKIGMKIEIPNPYVNCSKPVYWVATIRLFAGYKALVQYETFGYGDPVFGWISFASSIPKPIGYAMENGILLYPPISVVDQNANFLHLLQSLVGEYTKMSIAKDHVDQVQNAIKAASTLYKLEDVVEAMNCNDNHERKLGRVTGIVGDRIYVTYIRIEEDTTGFWFNMNSHNVRPLGWCKAVGMEVTHVPKKAILPKINPDLLPECPSGVFLNPGMVFEVIHPFNLNRIAVGHVERILRLGYFVADINCNLPLISSYKFVFHVTSPWILPCGFCVRNGIQLAVPQGENENNFSWNTYCSKKNVQMLDLANLPPRPSNPFSTGDKFEAIDLRQPTFAGPVTVVKVAEHLILLHFDGWERTNAGALQWMDCETHDIYPAGWCELTGHEFQGHPSPPRAEDNPMKPVSFLH